MIILKKILKILFLILLHSLILLDRLGGDGSGGFTGGGVVLLGVGCGGADGAPSLATRHSEGDCATGQQRQDDGFNDFVHLIRS